MNSHLKFDSNYPQIDSSNIFSQRHEISYVLKEEAEVILISKILKLFPEAKIKKEIIATTYFEPVLDFEPEKTCVVRFRQRVFEASKIKSFKVPKKWILAGPGNLEVKFRGKDRKKVVKMGLFLPRERDLHTLMKLSKNKLGNQNKLKEFISNLIKMQMNATENISKRNLGLITKEAAIKISKCLTPHATRINMRATFNISTQKNARITLESKPSFYAYPIEHCEFEESPYRDVSTGFLAESPKRVKIDIKTKNKNDGENIEKKLLLATDSHLKVPKNKYTKDSYYTLIVNASKRSGVVVEEYLDCEVEAKANILGNVDIKSLLEEVRILLIHQKHGPYRLFLTDPSIDERGKSELSRTIVGWINNGKWHEVVTIIRLNRFGVDEHGIAAILKWKKDPEDNTRVMNRVERKEVLYKDISNTSLLKRVGLVDGIKPQIVGAFRKMKFRIIVQDRDGRNFTVSLDESKVANTKAILRQLEVEYRHIVLANNNKIPKISVEASCEKCMNYFINLLKKLGVSAEKTTLRKIDFVGSSFRKKNSTIIL